MLLGEALLSEYLLESMLFESSWTNSYAFNYVAGTTVSLTTAITSQTCEACMYEVYAGESLDSLILVPNGIKTAVLFENAVTGSVNLYVRIIMKSTHYGVSPRIESVGLLIEQASSLYTIVTMILDDGLTPSGSTWLVDTELQKYLIPYAWFDTVKHRYALGKVAEAAGGVAYQDRYGVVRVDAGNYIARNITSASDYEIEADRIYDASSPVSVVANRIQIKTKPYIAGSETTIWELSGDNVINNGESRTFDVYYTICDVVIDAYASLDSAPSGATITDEDHYSWGASITVLGSADDQVLTLSILGKPLTIVGARVVERSDGDSIRRNGDQTLTLDDNNMIQSAEVAGVIADAILANTKQESRDIAISWRGDPTIELGDKGEVTGYDSILVEQTFDFDGMLGCKARFRRV